MSEDLKNEFHNDEEKPNERTNTVINDTGETDEFNGEDNTFLSDDYKAQKIIIPETALTNEKITNKGLKVFCILLACVIVISGFSFGGYLLGQNSLKKPNNNNSQSITLQNRPADGDMLSATKIYENVSNSVVGILVYNDKEEVGEASGVVCSEDGYIVTNDHIYSSIPSAKFKIFMNDGTEYDAYYVAGDTRSDLAVLKISDNVKLDIPTFGDSDKIITGESVCAIGYPNGYSAKSTITCGIVSAPKVRMSITTSYSSNFIQTDTAINPGNSGGALVNAHGQIIGITSSKISGTAYEGVGFAIPTKTVQKVVASLIENGNVKNRARLGISYNFINSVMAELNKLPASGLLVREVANDSNLYGRIKEGDIITRVNDVEIKDDSIILDILEELEPGSTILLTVLKQSGDSVNLSVVLLSDEGSSSYINSNSLTDKEQQGGSSFDWPEGF